MAKDNTGTVGGVIRLPWFEYLFGSFRSKIHTPEPEGRSGISQGESRAKRDNYRETVDKAIQSGALALKLLKEI